MLLAGDDSHVQTCAWRSVVMCLFDQQTVLLDQLIQFSCFLDVDILCIDKSVYFFVHVIYSIINKMAMTLNLVYYCCFQNCIQH